MLTLWVAPPECSAIGIGFNGAETNCRIAHILGILLMNSCNTDIFLSNYYHLQSVRFELAKFVFSVTRELTSESPIDSCQEELSPSDPIESVCLLFQPPSLLLTVTSATTDQRPYTHFRFRSRSDSIRPRVKTTRLRLSVLDMYDLISTILRILVCVWVFFLCNKIFSQIKY